jgi:hypothetical protein
LLIILIAVVAGFTNGLFNTDIGGSSLTANPPSSTPLQTPTSTSTNQSTSSTVTSPTSPSGYYLPYGGNMWVDGNLVEQAGTESQIFLVSANASYGTYPFPTVTSPNGNGTVLAEKGEPCVIINATIRNDYSTQNPPPNPNPETPTLAFVYLTAYLFNGENQINATDITPVVGFANGGAFASLTSGKGSTLTIYLATNSTDLTSFQVVARYISGMPVP